MRLVLAALCGAAAFVVDASGSTGSDWKKLKYFHHELYDLALGTSTDWSNAVNLPASKAGFVPSTLPSWARERGERVDAIWDDTCKKGAQKVAFTRSFLAPGDASKAVGWLTYSAATGSAIKEVRVLLNGVLIAKAGPYRSGVNQIGPKTGDPAPLAAALKAFKFGSNALTIRVTKGAKSTGCGVSFALLAEFAADVQLGKSADDAKRAAVPRYAKVDPGASVAGQVDGTIRNDGPSVGLVGVLTVTVSGDFQLKGANLQANGFECGGTVLDPPRSLVTFECPWTDFLPGSRKSVKVTFTGRVTQAVNFDEKKIEIGFHLGYRGGRRTGGAVTSLNVVFVACGPTADEEGCKNPKGWGG